MSETWIKAIVLVCTFGAVLLAVEALVSWLFSSKAELSAINERMKLIARGKTRGETLQVLRRSSATDTSHLPPGVAAMVAKFERTLTAAQVRTSAGRMLFLLAA